MEFEWDERKRLRVIQEHGIDLRDAALIFENEIITRIDDRRDYGEVRFMSLGIVDDDCIVVIHTERDGVMRLITAWKGGQDERDLYKEGISRRH